MAHQHGGGDVNSVEVAPGVHVDADGKAFGPKLEEALACYADCLTLDAWAARDPGQRRWRMQPEPAGFVGCTLHDNRLDADGTDRTGYSARQIRELNSSWHNCWTRTFGNPDRQSAHNPGHEARRAAADAIRNGRVPT